MQPLFAYSFSMPSGLLFAAALATEPALATETPLPMGPLNQTTIMLGEARRFAEAAQACVDGDIGFHNLFREDDTGAFLTAATELHVPYANLQEEKCLSDIDRAAYPSLNQSVDYGKAFVMGKGVERVSESSHISYEFRGDLTSPETQADLVAYQAHLAQPQTRYQEDQMGIGGAVPDWSLDHGYYYHYANGYQAQNPQPTGADEVVRLEIDGNTQEAVFDEKDLKTRKRKGAIFTEGQSALSNGMIVTVAGIQCPAGTRLSLVRVDQGDYPESVDYLTGFSYSFFDDVTISTGLNKTLQSNLVTGCDVTLDNFCEMAAKGGCQATDDALYYIGR